MFEFLKSTIVPFLFPVPFCLVILFVGIVLLWSSKKQKTGRILITFGFFLMLLFAFPFFPNFLLGNLEKRYPLIESPQSKPFQYSEIKFIVVLSGDHVLDKTLPITSQFSYSGLVRLIEGIRLYRKSDGARLILSGGIGRGQIADAALMASLCSDLGIPKDDIILEKNSNNTFEEAMFIKPIVENQNFLLVTSAFHMSRAMALFKKQGMNPIPAPTGHFVKYHENATSIMPSAFELLKSYAMIYEYLGLAKEKLLGRI